MAEINDFVALDLGASTTRTTSANGKIYEIPNDMVFVQESTVVDLTPYENGDDKHDKFISSMDITIRKISGGACEHFPCRVLVGEIAERYSPVYERPSVLKNKSQQRINYVSAIVAAAHQKIVAGNSDRVDLYIALPPVEIGYSKYKVADKLTGKFEVVLNKCGKQTVILDIASVTCVEESFMALVSFFFDMNGRKTPMADKYGDGYILSLDIGASTTDVCIVKNMRYVEKSGQTIKTGVNVIQANISNVVRGEYGYDPTQEVLETITETGRMMVGNTYVDMSQHLHTAKMEFAKTVIEQLQSYFRLTNIPLQTVRAIVVSGGGSIESGYKNEEGSFVSTCKSVSHYVSSDLKDTVPGIDIVCVEVEPRWANIKGVFIRASMINAKKRKEAMQAAGVMNV